jgi:hypothetical protein
MASVLPYATVYGSLRRLQLTAHVQFFGITGAGLSKIRNIQNGGKRARHSIDQWDRQSAQFSISRDHQCPGNTDRGPHYSDGPRPSLDRLAQRPGRPPYRSRRLRIQQWMESAWTLMLQSRCQHGLTPPPRSRRTCTRRYNTRQPYPRFVLYIFPGVPFMLHALPEYQFLVSVQSMPSFSSRITRERNVYVNKGGKPTDCARLRPPIRCLFVRYRSCYFERPRLDTCQTR